jgi:O-antigen/teichoic acid export membrane protein
VTTATAPTDARSMPPVLGRLMSGTFWMALRTPLQAVLAFFSIPLIIGAIGPEASSAYAFAWGFGFFQFLFEFGMSSSLQRQASETWTRGDRAGVDRVIACGMNFYAAMSVVQVLALLGVAYLAVPHSVYDLEGRRLIVRLLWLQVFTTPCFGISMVASSVLQAARRYDFLPRFELAIIILRFVVLVVGLAAGVDFFLVVVAQTVVQIALSLGPSLWVMVRELGHVPHFYGARRADYAALMHISFYMFLIQLSVVLADKIDTTILGFALADESANAVYMFVSKPFVQIRQTGWTLAYLVMPAVASLAAARDLRGLERVKYDGPRLHIGVLMPIALLAFVYAGPFLRLWVGDRLDFDAADLAPLMRLFLLATLPLALAVPVQMAIGMNKIKVIALAALVGSLVNLPISYYLTRRLGAYGVIWGVSGVVWGTVLTTLFSNLLVPGVYVFRVLEVRVRTFLSRTLSAPLAGAAALVASTWLLRLALPPDPLGTTASARTILLLGHLAFGSLAYVAGYLAVPTGRGDLAALVGWLRRRLASTPPAEATTAPFRPAGEGLD